MIYYVYEHWRPDKNIPFYVGKGKGRRAWATARKNHHHKAIVEILSAIGLCVEVRLVIGELDESQAFAVEKERIAFWRSQGIVLANLSGGGEGISNPSDETRAKLSVASKNRIRTPEWRANIAASVARSYTPELRARKSAILSGFVMSEETRSRISASKKDPPQETRDRNRNAAQNNWLIPGYRENQIANHAGRIRITDGVRNRFIKADAIIPVGWHRGRTQRASIKTKAPEPV